VGLAYNYELGPWLIHRVSGYWPSFEYQRFSIDEVLRPAAFARGAHLTLVFFASLFADFSPIALTGLVLLGVGLVQRPRDPNAAMPGQRREWPLISIVAIAGFVAAQFLLVILMVVRQPYMYDIRDGWRWYHPLPMHAMTLFGLLWLLESRGASRDTRQERWAIAGLAVVIIANLIGWAPHRAQMEQGPWFGRVSRQSASLRESLRAGMADSTLEGVYRRFYFYCLESAPAILVRSRSQAGEAKASIRPGSKGIY
jgi:hypothetical protein